MNPDNTNAGRFFSSVSILFFFLFVIGSSPAHSMAHDGTLQKGQSSTQSSAVSSSGTWNSSIVYKGPDGALIYHSDEDGNRIPDFSHAGYRGGGVPLPDVPVRITLDPSTTGDDTEQIQQALDDVGEMALDENGHRGAVLLNPGNYHISSLIEIRESGVVLRGSGDGADPQTNTIIQAARGIGSLSIQIGRGTVDWTIASGSPLTQIVTDFVPVGSRHFEVADASGFEVGDDVVIFHRATRAWIEAVDYGGLPVTDPDPWSPTQANLNIVKKRRITGISGNVIAIDVPVYNHLERSLSEALLYKPGLGGQISEAGVEDFRLILESDTPTSTNHGYNAIIFNGVTDSWADGVTVLHFQHTGLGTNYSSFVSIINSNALEPHSPVEPPLRYNFNVTARSNNILFENVVASEGRHCFVSNGTASVSGVVFLRSTSYRATGTSEGHRRWSQGLLFDNIDFKDGTGDRAIGLWNRGGHGTRHGWSSAQSAVWNSDPGSARIVIQQPPTAQNYGIANRGTVTGEERWGGPAGFIEGTGQVPELTSLYDAQLQDRMDFGIPPDTPARLTAHPTDQNTNMRLQWSHVSLEPKEIIIQRSVNGGPFEELTRVSSEQSSFVDESVDLEEYHYRLAAVDNGRMSAWSNIAGFDMNLPSFILRNPASGAVVELTGDMNQNLNLWWNSVDSDFEVTYTWYLDHAEGDFSDPLHSVETVVNLVQIPYGEMDQILNAAGVDSGAIFDGLWTVKASAHPIEIWADEPFDIRIIRSAEPTSTDPEDADRPVVLELEQNFPNPFNPETVISFAMPEAAHVTLVVYDLIGRVVERLVDEERSAGYHRIRWDASNYSSGSYIYRINAGGQSTTRVMTLMK
jgi:hypothetical protein